MEAQFFDGIGEGIVLGLRFCAGLFFFTLFRCLGTAYDPHKFAGWSACVGVCLFLSMLSAAGAGTPTCTDHDGFGCLDHADDGYDVSDSERIKRFGKTFGALLLIGGIGFMRGTGDLGNSTPEQAPDKT